MELEATVWELMTKVLYFVYFFSKRGIMSPLSSHITTAPYLLRETIPTIASPFPPPEKTTFPCTSSGTTAITQNTQTTTIAPENQTSVQTANPPATTQFNV